MSSTYTTIINGQEVEVAVVDPVKVDRTRQVRRAHGDFVDQPIGLTGIQKASLGAGPAEYESNHGFRKMPVEVES